MQTALGQRRSTCSPTFQLACFQRIAKPRLGVGMVSYRSIAVIVAASALLTVVQPAGAQDLQRMERQCSGNDGVPRPQQIDACTRLIETSGLVPEHLAAAFFNPRPAYTPTPDFHRPISYF